MSTTASRDFSGDNEHPVNSLSSPPLAPADSMRDDLSSGLSRSHNNADPEWPHDGSLASEDRQVAAADPTSRPRRKVIAGIAIICGLAVGAACYFLVPSARENVATPTPTAEPVPNPQSATAKPIPEPQLATQLPSSGLPEPPVPETSPGSAWPDPPKSAAPAPEQETPSSPMENATLSSPERAERREVLFLQRPGVNMRSAPSSTGRVLRTAPKGTRFEVTSRQGDWVQVENGSIKGWISARFLAPQEPR
jgi:hypothetical protein